MDSLRLPAKLGSLKPFQIFVTQKLKDQKLFSEIKFKIELVLEEILTNIFYYSNPSKETEDVVLECSIDKTRLNITIQDWGVPFNPLTMETPELSQDISERQIGGLGIVLVREMVDEINYRRVDDKNILTFSFKLTDNNVLQKNT